MSSFVMSPIPMEKSRGWTVTIDGEKKQVGMIEIESKYGLLTYGLKPEGYDGWVFREVGGGGSTTLPFACSPTGQLLVGLFEEDRANMGDKPVWCIIGGFVGPKELHVDAQVRRAAEEAGLDTRKARMLGGLQTNPNRAFFVADANGGEGVLGFALRIPLEHLEPDGEGWKIVNNALLPDFTKINKVRLFPWRTAAKLCSDGIANSVILKFLAEAL